MNEYMITIASAGPIEEKYSAPSVFVKEQAPVAEKYLSWRRKNKRSSRSQLSLEYSGTGNGYEYVYRYALLMVFDDKEDFLEFQQTFATETFDYAKFKTHQVLDCGSSG